MLLRLSRINCWLFILALAFASNSWALGFGEVKVYSYLDEPLSAEIELMDLGAMDTEQIVVSLADPNVFVQAGLQRPFFLTTLSFLVNNVNNMVVLAINSTKVVKEPYLEFIISVSWPGGKIFKRITILIDPPPMNLSSDTRAISLSEKAYKEQEVKQFGQDKMLETANQQVITAKPQDDKNRLTKFSDATMVDTYGPNNPAPVGAATVPAKTTPAQVTPVPVITSPLTTAPVTPAPVTTVPITTAPVTTAPVTTVPVTTVPVTTVPVTPVPVTSSPAPVASAPVIREIPKSTVNKPNPSIFDQAISALKAVDSSVGTDIDLTNLDVERKKHSDIFKEDTQGPNPDIDFGDVIKPASKSSATTGATALGTVPGAPGTSPRVPGTVGVAQVPPAATSSGHNGLFLIVAGFILGITAAVAFVVKKGLYKKYLPMMHGQRRETISEEFITQDEEKIGLESNEDFSTVDFDKHEEIELSTVTPEKSEQDLDLDKFEEELNALEHGNAVPQIATSGKREASTTKSMSDLLKLSGNKISDTVSPVVATKIPEPKPEPEPKIEPKIEPKVELNDEPLKFDLDELHLDLVPAPVESPVIEDAPVEIKQVEGLRVEPEIEPTEAIKVIPTIDVHEEIEITAPVAPVEAEHSTGGLRLEPENHSPATLTADEEAIKLKLDLAKKYLEAGDKESAKAVLNEIIERAKDAQRLEAEVILSGIL